MDSSDSSSSGGKDGCAACCAHRLFRSCKNIWNYKCEVFVNAITAKCEWQVWLNTAQLPLSLSLQLDEWIWNRQYDGLIRFFELWRQRWLCCLLPPSFLQKLQVHLKLQMRSIRECDYSEVWMTSFIEHSITASRFAIEWVKSSTHCDV